MKKLLSLFKFKKEKREEEEETPFLPIKKEPVTSFDIGEIPKFKTVPQLVFVGSGKGGVGKSFISSNLAVIVAALSKKKVFAVDLDLDNYTLSEVVPPPGTMQKLIAKLRRASVDDYLNLALILHTGIVPNGILIPVIPGSTFGCNGIQISYNIRLIPAYNILKAKEQRITLRTLDSRLLRDGIDALLEFFIAKKNKGEDFVAIFDGKQKSNIGIEYEPLYRLMLEQSDVFILVTEPPYLTFSTIVAPYRNVLEKLVIVVNKAEHSHRDKILVLIRDALDRNVPVFIVPKVPADEEIYKNMYSPPAAQKLTRRTSLYIMALAYFLNLLDDNALSTFGCDKPVYAILRMMGQLYSSLK